MNKLKYFYKLINKILILIYFDIFKETQIKHKNKKNIKVSYNLLILNNI